MSAATGADGRDGRETASPADTAAVVGAISAVTARSLLSRRRALLMLLLAAVPVLVGLLARARGVPGDAATSTASALEALVVATLLPLVALVFGTSALGAELEDGSALHLLTKPIARWQIVLAKVLAAVPVTAGLVGVTTLLTGLLIGGDRGAFPATVALTVGVVVGAIVYTTAFVALSVVTTRALIIGLVYVAIWEGALAGLFTGTRVLSVRQYVTGIAAGVDSSGAIADAGALAFGTAVVASLVVTVVAFAIAVHRLERYQIAAGD